MKLKTLDEIDFTGKRVLLRAGFDMPLDELGDITDDTRIRSTLPTINFILKKGAKQVVIITHMGRPKGQVVEKLKLDKVAEKLSELLVKKVVKMDGCVDILTPEDSIILLENLRFKEEETSKDDKVREEFAEKLSKFGDIYINDAFSVCHRKNASVYDIVKFFKGRCGVGFLVQDEIQKMLPLVEAPEKPFYLILGGLKVSDKIKLIDSVAVKADKVLIDGGMANSFFKAKGFNVGKSPCENPEIAKSLIEKYGNKIIIGQDCIVAKPDYSETEAVNINQIPANKEKFDIGPSTIELFKKELADATSIFWNGPLGKVEVEKFSKGTEDIAKFLSKFEDKKIVIGGGDTAGIIKSFNLGIKFYHISTGGGASLEFMSGEKLPALEILEEFY